MNRLEWNSLRINPYQMLCQVQFSASSAILFQNGDHLKISNLNKNLIYEPIGMKLAMHKALSKYYAKFNFQLRPPSWFKMAAIWKFQIQIRTVFMSRFKWNSQYIKSLPNAQPGSIFSFVRHLVWKWRPFKSFKFK